MILGLGRRDSTSTAVLVACNGGVTAVISRCLTAGLVTILAFRATEGAVKSKEKDDEWYRNQGGNQTRIVALSQHLELSKVLSDVSEQYN